MLGLMPGYVGALLAAPGSWERAHPSNEERDPFWLGAEQLSVFSKHGQYFNYSVAV